MSSSSSSPKMLNVKDYLTLAKKTFSLIFIYISIIPFVLIGFGIYIFFTSATYRLLSFLGLPKVFQKVVDSINHRPRKSLDYRTSYEVFFASSEPVAFHP
jgi:hypothetical protein